MKIPVFVFVITLGFISCEDAKPFPCFENCILEKGVNASNIVPRSDSKLYTNLNYQWQQKLPTIRPEAFILVRTEENVVAAVSCGRKHNVSVVALSGGHSYNKYSFGNENSVIIDLQFINSVSLDATASKATIGAGALVGPIEMTLWNKAKVTIPLSSCPNIGISGLSTGGGYSHLSRMYGMTSDNILSMRIVTADGQLRNVNKHVNSDLYWALRGGGAASFGIVTTFTFKVVPAPTSVYMETWIWNMTSFVKSFEAWQHFAVEAPRSISGNFFVVSGLVIGMFYDFTGSSLRLKNILQPFPSPTSKSEELFSYPDFLVFDARYFLNMTGGFGPQDLLGLNRMSSILQYLDVKSFYMEKVTSEDDLELLHSTLQKIPPTVAFYLQPYGGAINDLKSRETAFVHRKGRTQLVAITNLANPQNATEISAAAWLPKIFELGKKIFHQKESYQNYADPDLGDYLARYYGKNLQRLVQIKQTYDPENYFNNPQSIPINI